MSSACITSLLSSPAMPCLKARRKSLHFQSPHGLSTLGTCSRPSLHVVGSTGARRGRNVGGRLPELGTRNVGPLLALSQPRRFGLNALRTPTELQSNSCNSLDFEAAAFIDYPEAQHSSDRGSHSAEPLWLVEEVPLVHHGIEHSVEEALRVLTAAMPTLTPTALVGYLFAVCAYPASVLAEGAVGDGGASGVVEAVEQQGAVVSAAAPAWLQPAILTAPLLLYGGFYWYRDNVNQRLSPFDYVTLLLIVLAVANLVLAFFFKIRLF